jgi:hypothetical protein
VAAVTAMPCPWSIRLLVTTFIVLHSGIEVSYGAWISSYAIEKHVTRSDEDAAFIESSYWAALTIGSIRYPAMLWWRLESILLSKLLLIIVIIIIILLVLILLLLLA